MGLELPTNIKQIGSIGEGMRIYFEEYAYSYFQQYAESAGYEGRMGILIGKRMVIDEQAVLFVTGAIQAPYLNKEGDFSVFSTKTWQYADEMLDKYFDGLEVVGWAMSQPGFGVFLSEAGGQYHRNSFTESHMVIFVTDPEEGLSAFYTWGEEAQGDARAKNAAQARRPIESRGYFIYYDKNKGMHEYMLDNLIPKPEPVAGETEEDGEHAAGVIKDFTRRREARPARPRQAPARVVNMLVAVSAVLFVACVVMGAGMIQNSGRLADLSTQVAILKGTNTDLSTANRDLIAEVTSGGSTPAFKNGIGQEPTAAAQQTPAGNAAGQSAAQNAQANTQPAAQPAGQSVQADSAVQSEQAAAAGQTAPPAPADTMANLNKPNSDIPATYTIASGDTLDGISLKFYGTRAMVDRIMQANNITDKNKIMYGKVLRLPQP